jgi:1-acyl-sn-glycerol-3-phosphate acyltransferase
VLYPLLKQYGRLVFHLYCPVVRVNRPQMLAASGPLLLAANHPNSFLDGMILTTLFEQPVYSLARGDAFRKPRANRILRYMRLLPVYRTSEGVENLEHNYTTFAACVETFRKQGIVLIFSEGRCENEWHLRPLKKGTARLAFAAWQQGLPLRVVPVAFNYSSFKKFGKEVHLYFGDPIDATQIDAGAAEGKRLLQFNTLLQSRLAPMVYEIGNGDRETYQRYFGGRKGWTLPFLLLPALAGALLHAPLYFPLRQLARRYFLHNGHYDSVQAALLMLVYPLYLLLLLALLAPLFGWMAAPVALLLLPLTARAAVEVKTRLHL